jgi:hypothetical protein
LISEEFLSWPALLSLCLLFEAMVGMVRFVGGRGAEVGPFEVGVGVETSVLVGDLPIGMRRVSGTAGARKGGESIALPFGVSEDGEERTDEEVDILPGDSSDEEGLGKANG